MEGNNVNSDAWVAEHVKPTVYAEPSGNACDHYHRYPDDIALMSNLGLVAVDRSTLKRSIKPSAVFLGSMARRNAV